MGSGCAGLSLLMRMIQSGVLEEKKILLIDRTPKKTNDRTWCFWEKENGFFDDIVFKKWKSISFLSEGYSATLEIQPYVYKMIRGIDFYNYCFAEIKKHANIEIAYGEAVIINGQLELNENVLQTGDAVIFNSIYTPAPKQKNDLHLLQHFKGWIIETPQPHFDVAKATFMDFRVHQDYGTTFVYTLPLDEKTALVEYTLFTKDLLQHQQYDRELEEYIKDHLKVTDYTVKEKEFGVIPMTNEKFKFYGNGVYNIGTAGGQTKSSSGYTFQFIQKQSKQIVDALIAGKPLSSIQKAPARFNFYDHTLLYLLYHDKLKGSDIFTTLFKKNKPQQVLRFLDNETSLSEEVKIISSLPTWPFLQAALRH